MTEVHVVRCEQGWTIEVRDFQRNGFHTQVEAVLAGCRLVEEQGGEVVVHGEEPAPAHAGPLR